MMFLHRGGFQGGFQGGCQGGAPYMHGIGGFPLGGIITLLVVAILLVVAYKLYQNYKMTTDPVLESLRMKYVTGEITEEEYVQKKRILIKK